MVNKNSMQLAKEITETVMRDNHYDLHGGHYIKGISEVAAKHGLLRDDNFYENLYNGPSSTYSDHKMSRNELYEHVYNSVIGFFYEGHTTHGYYHAEELYKAHTPMGLGVAHFENVGYLPTLIDSQKILLKNINNMLNSMNLEIF